MTNTSIGLLNMWKLDNLEWAKKTINCNQKSRLGQLKLELRSHPRRLEVSWMTMTRYLMMSKNPLKALKIILLQLKLSTQVLEDFPLIILLPVSLPPLNSQPMMIHSVSLAWR